MQILWANASSDMVYMQTKVPTACSGHKFAFGLSTSPACKAAPRQRYRFPPAQTHRQEAAGALQLRNLSHGICLAAQLRKSRLQRGRADSSEQEGVCLVIRPVVFLATETIR